MGAFTCEGVSEHGKTRSLDPVSRMALIKRWDVDHAVPVAEFLGSIAFYAAKLTKTGRCWLDVMSSGIRPWKPSSLIDCAKVQERSRSQVLD